MTQTSIHFNTIAIHSFTHFIYSGSGPVSLAESMAMVDEILANGTMDRMDRIEKLESLLSAATNLASPSPTPLKPVMVDSQTQV